MNPAAHGTIKSSTPVTIIALVVLVAALVGSIVQDIRLVQSAHARHAAAPTVTAVPALVAYPSPGWPEIICCVGCPLLCLTLIVLVLRTFTRRRRRLI